MTKLDSILKNRNITLPTKVCMVKDVVFPVVKYRCESWTIKKAEGQRIDAFELWCWRNSWESLGLQGDQTSWSWRKSILTIHWKDSRWCSNTLSTWCKEPTPWKRPWCWERLRAGGEKGATKDEMLDASLTQWTWVWTKSRRWWRTGNPGMLQSMGSQRVRSDTT